MRWLVVAVAALLVGLLAYGVTAQGTDKTIDSALAKGEHIQAPSSPLPRLGHPGTSSIGAYRGRVVLVNFWASWCPPCLQELPLLERTQKRMRAAGGTVLGINTRDASEDALRFVRRFHLTFPSIRDGSGDFANRYGLTGYPESFLLDRDGRIAAANRGPVTRQWINTHVIPLLHAS
jgi:cytochrome c biogenesis protein CcmG, thiol:disulfide interchange protein DsbE